jgi:hypothetical protein
MPESLRFTDAEKAAFRSVYCSTATDEQFGLFIQECERRQLVPGKDVVFQLRTSSEWNAELRQKVFIKKVILITTIGALRLIAERCGRYEGRGPFVYYYGAEGGDLKESKIPLGKIPHAVSVEGYRKDWRHPLFSTARYDAYVQMQGKDDDRRPTQMWATRGEEQLAKCAEAAMLRTVAPEECSGLMVAEEMNDIISREDAVPEVPAAPVMIPAPAIAPAVNQKAEHTVDPTPVPSPLVEAAIPPPMAVPVSPVQQSQDFFSPGPTPAVPQVPEVVPPPTPAPPAVVVPAGEQPATQKQIAEFLARAAKIIRDTLPKANMKDKEAADGVKHYLLTASGKSSFRVIPAEVFDKLLRVLESAATPEDAAAIVKASK